MTGPLMHPQKGVGHLALRQDPLHVGLGAVMEIGERLGASTAAASGFLLATTGGERLQGILQDRPRLPAHTLYACGNGAEIAVGIGVVQCGAFIGEWVEERSEENQ